MGKTLPTERPILFSAPMVRALLEGRKTQTRRICKDAMVDHFGEAWPASSTTFDGKEWVARWPEKLQGKTVSDGYKSPQEDRIRCPFGLPIDRLWVRETWGLHRHHDYTCWNRDSIAGRTAEDLLLSWQVAYAADATSVYDHWRPSIHMPRWASRSTLEGVAVRVERLQGISEEDARAEGVEPPYDEGTLAERYGSYEEGFERLWKSINGAESWAANPWVWVVEFKRVQP